MQEEFLGEEFLGEKYMGEKYMGEKSVGEKSLGENRVRWDAGFRSPPSQVFFLPWDMGNKHLTIDTLNLETKGVTDELGDRSDGEFCLGPSKRR